MHHSIESTKKGNKVGLAFWRPTFFYAASYWTSLVSNFSLTLIEDVKKSSYYNRISH